jgi:large subunit ribosomal protein L23
MALFSRKKEAGTTQPTETAVAVVVPKKKALKTDCDLSAMIKGPRITEKSVRLGEANVYTFAVAKNATKFLVRDAVKALYGVTPVKVNIVSKRPALRLKGSQNRMVKEAGEKKAYVYLKKGDTINLV